MSIEWDIEDLICKVLGKTEEESSEIINNGTLEDLLCEKYDIDLETYCEIVKGLLPFTPKQKAALTGEMYHAFVHEGGMIVKIEAS